MLSLRCRILKYVVMKKLLLISLLMVSAFSLFAQEKGDMSISGSFSWTSQSAKEKSGSESVVVKGDRTFSIMPEFHYFICDKFSVGLGMGYSLNKTPNEEGDSEDQLFNKLGLFLVQPVARYYVSLGEKFYFVPRFYFGVGVGKYKQELGDSKTEDTDVAAFNIGLSLLNFEFKPCNKLGIMFNAGDLKYEVSTVKVDSDNKYSARNFNLGLNLGATIGFNYYFGK